MAFGLLAGSFGPFLWPPQKEKQPMFCVWGLLKVVLGKWLVIALNVRVEIFSLYHHYSFQLHAQPHYSLNAPFGANLLLQPAPRIAVLSL